MKRLFLFFFFLSAGAYATAGTDTAPHRKGELIVLMKAGANVQTLLEKNAWCNGIPTKLQISLCLAKTSGIWLLQFDSIAVEEEQLLRNVRSAPGVALAQFNHYISQRGIPDDTQFANQYALNNTGQAGGTVDADIDAVEAWDVTTGGLSALGDTIVVAVIDAGFQVTHPDLNFWKNYHEIAGNGIDDDGNGYVDDVNGWNVFLHNNTIVNNQHGTHVAGIVGARGNNNLGVSGVCWNVKLMPVVGATTVESQAIEAYDYVMECRRLYNTSNGAKGAFVVATNSSFGVDHGLPANFPIWCAYYDSLGRVGVLSAGATANSNWDVDAAGDIPCNCPSPFFIGVSSTDRNDAKVGNSGYGVQSIDLAAPGASVYSTYTGSSYNTLTGTSMASPHVAGSIALMYAAACDSFMMDYRLYPDSIAGIMKMILMNAVDQKIGFDTLYYSGGRLNVSNAVHGVQQYGDCSTIGMGEQPSVFIQAIYPNPSIDEVSVVFTETNEQVSIELSDMAGRLLKNVAVGKGSPMRIDVSGLETGIYFLTIVSGAQRGRAEKLIKIN
ncbi:MAG: C-terminal target protein [Bacteroidetes bacterium]|jgi:hypothetical protein|nr:C-terminal target protein [Bacteroidota bacterium]